MDGANEGGNGGRGLGSADPRVLGGYTIVARLGAGGMGVVYLGRSGGGGQVAVKVMRSELAHQPEFRARFAREVAAARAVRGDFTARVLDADVEGPLPWVATEYVAGPTLAQQVEQAGPLPVGQARLLGLGLAEALAAIHGVGLVHRDLKPGNILLAAGGPKVIDFGIVRAAEETALTLTGGSVGSLSWMSPEQITGEPVSAAADVFALGLVLAQASSGVHPFGDGRAEAVAFRIVHQEPDLAGVPGGLRPAVAAMLVKDPGDRPSVASCVDLLDGGPADDAEVTRVIHQGWDVTRVAPPPPMALVGAAPPPAVGPAGKPARGRGRGVLVGAAVVGAVALLAGGIAVASNWGGKPVPEEQAQPTPESSTATASPVAVDFTGTCTWARREKTYDANSSPSTSYYEADCGPAGQLSAIATITGDSDYFMSLKYVLSGEIGGTPFILEGQVPNYDFQTDEGRGLDRWEGTFGSLPATLVMSETGNAWAVAPGSSIGTSAITGQGPSAVPNPNAYSPDDALLWDDPSTVTGRYYTEQAITPDLAAALVNLVTVGTPASGINYLFI